jgi:hypothetical protein
MCNTRNWLIFFIALSISFSLQSGLLRVVPDRSEIEEISYGDVGGDAVMAVEIEDIDGDAMAVDDSEPEPVQFWVDEALFYPKHPGYLLVAPEEDSVFDHDGHNKVVSHRDFINLQRIIGMNMGQIVIDQGCLVFLPMQVIEHLQSLVPDRSLNDIFWSSHLDPVVSADNHRQTALYFLDRLCSVDEYKTCLYNPGFDEQIAPWRNIFALDASFHPVVSMDAKRKRSSDEGPVAYGFQSDGDDIAERFGHMRDLPPKKRKTDISMLGRLLESPVAEDIQIATDSFCKLLIYGTTEQQAAVCDESIRHIDNIGVLLESTQEQNMRSAAYLLGNLLFYGTTEQRVVVCAESVRQAG